MKVSPKYLNHRRADIFDEFSAGENSWVKVKVPNRNDLTKLQNEFLSTETRIRFLKSQQPKCQNLMNQYEIAFASYKPQIQKSLRENADTLRQLSFFLFTKESADILKSTIKTLTAFRNVHRHLLNPELTEYTDRVLSNLSSLEHGFANSQSELFHSFNVLKVGLENRDSELKELLEQTHVWVFPGSRDKERCVKCSKEKESEEHEKARTEQLRAIQEKTREEELQKKKDLNVF